MASQCVQYQQTVPLSEGNDIVHGSNRLSGWRVGLTEENKMEYESQKSHLGSYWTFPVFTAFQTEDERHRPTFLWLTQPSYKRDMTSYIVVPKNYRRLTQGLG